MPIILFLVSLGGFLLAIGYFAFTTVFGGRLLAKCRVPGEAVFDLDPGMSPVEIAAQIGPSRAHSRQTFRVELEREGSWLWTRDVLPGESRGLFDDAVSVERFRVDHAGRYRVKGIPAGGTDGSSSAVAAIHVYARSPKPKASVYVLAGVMLAGGFVSLLVVLA
ncbi:MAG: hypothetical protein GC151_16975 [Betaproteobacteria bacterium]|nr:hypothetical protein [Betaproteobacteria bacterium]